MEGVQPGSVEGVGHDPAHGAHIMAAVGGAGAVAGAEPEPRRQAVVLGGVGVHNEDLRLRAVPLHREGQRALDLRRDLGCRDTGVVFDRARAAGDVLFPAALRVVLFQNDSCIGGAGIVPFQGDEIGRVGRGGSVRLGLGRGIRLDGVGRRGGLGGRRRLLPAEGKSDLGGGQRPDDKGRKAEQKPVGKESQGQHQRRRPGQGGELPGPGTCLPVAHGAHLLPSYKHMKNTKG